MAFLRFHLVIQYFHINCHVSWCESLLKMIFSHLSPLKFWEFFFLECLSWFIMLFQISNICTSGFKQEQLKFWELTQWNINNRFKVPKWNITFFPSVFLIVKFKCFRLSIHKMQWLPQLGFCCFPVFPYIFKKCNCFVFKNVAGSMYFLYSFSFQCTRESL